MKVFGLARLTNDPTMRGTCANFGIAWKHFNGDSQFFNCVAFNKTADTIIGYVKKGQRILIHGTLVNNHWTDKEGVKHYNEQIIVNTFEFIEQKSDKQATVGEQYQERKKYDSIDVDSDLLPF